MIFVRSEDLKVGMRVARPIYNKMGVLLYDRESALSPQAVQSVKNFGIIGLYILEPAEPAPPLTDEEIEFERFQTMNVFKIKDIMDAVLVGKPPKGIESLVLIINKTYTGMSHRFLFNQNLRSPSDYYYKHSLNVAVLCAMMASKMGLNSEATTGLISAAILHDVGMLSLPQEVLDKNEHDFTKSDIKALEHCGQFSYQLLQPATNPFDLSPITMRILKQTCQNYWNPRFPIEKKPSLSLNARILQVANAYDTLTAMGLQNDPISEIAAIRYLSEFPDYYDKDVIRILTECIHIVPLGSCIELSSGEHATVIDINEGAFMSPIVLTFESNRILDLSSPTVASQVSIVDVMRTMDNRIRVDETTLEQFNADPKLKSDLYKVKKKLNPEKKRQRLF